MTTDRIDIESISLGTLRRYLKACGWKSRVLPSSALELFALGNSEDQEVEIVLPTSSGAKDAGNRMALAVQTLASLNRQDAPDIIAEIRAIGFDLIRSRLPNASVRHDTIQLGTAAAFIQRLTKLLTASAHGELHAGPYFQSVDTNAIEYARSCRFAHTFRGSFGFTIQSPVGPNTNRSLEEIGPPPLERRIVQRFARGLLLVHRAVESQNPELIAGGYATGLNANGCEDLVSLVAASRATSILFEITLSSEWGFPHDLGPTPTVEIQPGRSVEIIKEGARLLRHIEFDFDRTISGTVFRLSSKDNPSDLFNVGGTRTVNIIWNSREYGSVNVGVALDPKDYLKALDAHRLGKDVIVTGTLEKRARKFSLTDPHDFAVLSGSVEQ